MKYIPLFTLFVFGTACGTLQNTTETPAQPPPSGVIAGGPKDGGGESSFDIQAGELSRITDTKVNENEIITRFKADSLFDAGQAALKPEAQSLISQVAQILKKYPTEKITVVGHTDNVGQAEANQILSEERARAVMLQLVQAGVAQQQVASVGMGPSQPLASNSSELGRAHNRRVEIQVRREGHEPEGDDAGAGD